MIARLFPLRIQFPKRWTAPWPGYLNDMLKHFYIDSVRELLNGSPLLDRLQQKSSAWQSADSRAARLLWYGPYIARERARHFKLENITES